MFLRVAIVLRLGWKSGYPAGRAAHYKMGGIDVNCLCGPFLPEREDRIDSKGGVAGVLQLLSGRELFRYDAALAAGKCKPEVKAA